MRKILVTILISLALSLSFAGFASSVEARTVRVKSYYKPRSGTFVQPSHRTSPNKSKVDNWSTKGNSNPYTGKKGTVDPLKLKFR